MAELHALHSAYTFWYAQRGGQRNPAQAAEDYEASIKQVADFGTVEAFWGVYSHMQRPESIRYGGSTELHLFKRGIKPIWEDPANALGGKLVIRLTRSLTNRMWELACLGLIAEEFSDDVTGLVLTLKQHDGAGVLAVWNRDANNSQAIHRIREDLRRALELPLFVRCEYKPHQKRMRGSKPRSFYG